MSARRHCGLRSAEGESRESYAVSPRMGESSCRSCRPDREVAEKKNGQPFSEKGQATQAVIFSCACRRSRARSLRTGGCPSRTNIRKTRHLTILELLFSADQTSSLGASDRQLYQSGRASSFAPGKFWSNVPVHRAEEHRFSLSQDL